MAIRLVVVDDSEVVRAGIIDMLAGTDIEVVAEAADCEQAVRATLTWKPDVVLLDLWMPTPGGVLCPSVYQASPA